MSEHLSTPLALAEPLAEPVQAYASLGQAATALLAHFRETVGFDCWTIERLDGNALVALAAVDSNYETRAGRRLPLADSLVALAIEGTVPAIAPASADVPEFTASPLAAQAHIGAFLAIPIASTDGSIIGALTALHPYPLQPGVIAALPVIRMGARLLATLLEREHETAAAARREETYELKQLEDRETGLYSEAGWRELLTGEESRAAQLGHEVGVIVLDIDDLKDLRFRATRPPSDWVLGRAVQSMRAHLPAGALTARVGASQLVALVANVEERATAKAIRAIQEELHAAHIDTTAGFAMREPGRGLLGAWINALTRLARPAPKRAPVARRPLPAKRAAPADATPPQDTAAATIETLSSRWDW